jgi:hypothetical protein
MIVLLEASPIYTEELCQSDQQVLRHLTDQGPSPQIAQFRWATSSRKSFGGSKLLPFTNDGGHCVLGDHQCCRNVLVPFPRSVSRQNPVSEVYRQFLQPSCRHISRMINGNKMHQSSIESKNLFSLCHYGVLCVD